MKASIIVALLTVVVASPLSDTQRYTTLRPELIPGSIPIQPADTGHGGAERICDTLSRYDGLAYYWRFPSRYGDKGYATRFSVGPLAACTVKAVRLMFYGPAMRGTPDLRIYLWDATGAGALPGNKLDSIDVPFDRLDTAYVYWVNAGLGEHSRVFKNQSFHVSCAVVGGTADTLAIISDDCQEYCFGHSSENYGGSNWYWSYCSIGMGEHHFLMEVDACCYETCCNHDGIRGDANNDAGIDVADVTFLVDYLFNDALTPECDEESDADASGETDISDLTHLVDYLFNGGPPPEPCP